MFTEIWCFFCSLWKFTNTVNFSGHNLSAKGFGHQWERTRTWSSWHNEELWRSCCVLLPTSTHRTGSQVCCSSVMHLWFSCIIHKHLCFLAWNLSTQVISFPFLSLLELKLETYPYCWWHLVFLLLSLKTN